MLLQPACKRKCVADMALDTQTQGLKTLDQLERAERVQAGTEITEDFNTDTDGEADWSKGFPELQSVVTF